MVRLEKALVLMSGGLDSATSLYWAKSKFDEVQAISFNYYDRVNREKIAARAITKAAHIKLMEVKIPFLKEKSEYFHFKSKSSGHPLHSYIPLRNLIFYSISGYFAQVNKIRNLVGGHNYADSKVFKDASGPYFAKMNELMVQGLLGSSDCHIMLPLKDMSRPRVIQLAIELHVPIQLTWSCHRESKLHCGHCHSCKERLNAFDNLGLTDPVAYSRQGPKSLGKKD